MNDGCCPAEHRTLTLSWRLGEFTLGIDGSSIDAVAALANQPALFYAMPTYLINQITLAVLGTATHCLSGIAVDITVGPILFHREDLPADVWEATA